jgi:hypothetical protein
VASKHMTNTPPDADSCPNMTEQHLQVWTVIVHYLFHIVCHYYFANRNVITDIILTTCLR